MKGLLLKDAYQTWCYIRWIILLSIAMMLMGTFFMKDGSNFFMLYGGLMLGMSPMTLLAYDQNSRFSAYCAALPVTKEQIVGGKYLIVLCGMVLAELLSMAALAAAQLLWGTVTVQLTVATLLQVAMLTLLGNYYFAAAGLPPWLPESPVCVLPVHRSACKLYGIFRLFGGQRFGQHPARQRFAAGAGGRAGSGTGAVCCLVAAVRCMVRKGRAVR